MLSLNNIKATPGSRKNSKRVGRGNGSKGAFSGRGMNGQNARSGGGVAPWFEGGQTPLFRRMPKLKGFSNAKFKTNYVIITFRDLELLAVKGVTKIDEKELRNQKMIGKANVKVKLLAKGDLKSKFDLVVDKASANAISAIEKAGGKVEILGEINQQVKQTKTGGVKKEDSIEESAKVKKTTAKKAKVEEKKETE